MQKTLVWKRASYLTAYDPETSETSQTQCLYLFRNIDLFDPRGCKSNISKQPGKAINFKYEIYGKCSIEGAMRLKNFNSTISENYYHKIWFKFLVINKNRTFTFKKQREILVLIYLLKTL